MYQEKLDEVLKVYTSGFDIMIEMTEFLKSCKCEFSVVDHNVVSTFFDNNTGDIPHLYIKLSDEY